MKTKTSIDRSEVKYLANLYKEGLVPFVNECLKKIRTAKNPRDRLHYAEAIADLMDAFNHDFHLTVVRGSCRAKYQKAG